jgi:hypothetical protein
MLKKLIATMLLLSFLFILSSCFDYTTYPDMVEYSFDEVLKIAEDKYSINKWIFKDDEIHGKYSDGNLNSYKEIKLVNGDNLDVAFTSFAGKNGNHDIQGMYGNFICYYALGTDINGNAKFIFYNINLNKDASIYDTIGSSDYLYEVLPNKVVNLSYQIFNKINYDKLSLEINNQYKDLTLSSFNYNYDRLTVTYGVKSNEKVKGDSYLEFYLEDENIVYDYYRINDKKEYVLKYSSSNKYAIIYDCYECDIDKYVDINYTIDTSTEDNSLDLIKGEAVIKENEVDGNIIYSWIVTKVSYKNRGINDNIIDSTYSNYGEKETKIGLLMPKIEGIDHKETTKVKVTDLYILFQKSNLQNA